MGTHCFTYGTLMCADIMATVCGRNVSGGPASLGGFARHAVSGEDYPGIQPCRGAHVLGVLYRDLDVATLGRLDAFEGDLYRRETVEVQVSEGPAIRADTYVFKPEHTPLLLPEDWNFDAFLSAGKARFQARYLGFSRLV